MSEFFLCLVQVVGAAAAITLTIYLCIKLDLWLKPIIEKLERKERWIWLWAMRTICVSHAIVIVYVAVTHAGEYFRFLA
ncbi:MAG: hypothetical protein EOP82_15820 [Variovorax sp.]|nr:MAG: hypothetical protein EOP82_15820 [Variovorax sp.]